MFCVAPLSELSRKGKLCTCPPLGNFTISVPDAYRFCSPSIEKSPFRILSPNAIPNGAKRSFNAGIFAPPVIGVHQLLVLSSKNLIFTIVSTLYHSANTVRPSPVLMTSSLSLLISSGKYSSSRSTSAMIPVPVEDVIPNIQGVSRNITGWVLLRWPFSPRAGGLYTLGVTVRNAVAVGENSSLTDDRTRRNIKRPEWLKDYET
ncbi:SITE-1 protease [Actinidia rufa]|uniref:SITE-1 protease n=1 Tax=Actinidia rufa TaxID=165716 RepID=A0A7J0DMD0_9ERIC|nr:SITE-1 protease [Actinidia rufa]